MDTNPREGTDFIREVIDADLAAGRHTRVVTRFPPEPNGYLHIGHAKAICINFGVAGDYGGTCHLRFDDTNPTTEDTEYVEAIKRDVRWLGFDWGEGLYFASDFFSEMAALAEGLIRDGRAYVCDLTEEEFRACRGTVTEPGTHSPHRGRSVEENLALWEKMKAGDFLDGHCVLRAKGDMTSPNMKMRDPPLYRIRHATHHRTGDDWCIYPMYDYAHPLEDALEGVTHSLCSLEFDNNREIYDWVIDNTAVETCPRQYEFARLNITYTVMSKRFLLRLVEEGHVSGWDDPRMPSLAGLRRRGVPPEAIVAFVNRVGVAKTNSTAEVELFEHMVRDHLNRAAPRAMCVLDPLRVVVENVEEGRVEPLEAPSFPRDVGLPGSRMVPLTREILIERGDFSETPPKGWRRLSPGGEVRLMHGYLLKCERVIKDETGRVVELRCSIDLESAGGGSSDGRRVRGVIHWVSATLGVPAEVRLIHRLFTAANPGRDGDFMTDLNPDSLEVLAGCVVEPAAAASEAGARFQFVRHGYFAMDPDRAAGAPVFNRIVPLRDSWGKKRGDAKAPTKATAKTAKGGPTPARDPDAGLDEAGRVRRDGYVSEHSLPVDDARRLARTPEVAAFFESALSAHGDARAVANWLVNELPASHRGPNITELPFDGAAVGRLVKLRSEGRVSGAAAKTVFGHMLSGGGDPAEIMSREGLDRMGDDGVSALVAEVIAARAAEAARYRAGEKKLMGFFVGQVMRASRGKADPKVVSSLLREHLAG